MKFIVAEKNLHQGAILTVTDKDILGKKYEEGKKQLDLANKFYSGEEKDTEYIKVRMEDAYVIHLTGKKAVAFGIEMGLVDKKRIITIAGIPHAEVLIEK